MSNASGDSEDLSSFVGLLLETVANRLSFFNSLQSSIRISSMIRVGIKEKELFQTTHVMYLHFPFLVSSICPIYT
jgi:positive regulator of sigma E activity